jgi:hypothetical protein
MHPLVVFAKALIISWALIYLIEYFDWHWVREAGGGFPQRKA